MSEINKKTTYKELKDYIKDNGYQKIYLEKNNKAYTKAKKEELLNFVKEQEEIKQMESNVDTIFGNVIKDNSDNVEDLCKPETPHLQDEKDDEIEEIPIFTNSTNPRELQSQIGNISEDKNIKLNNAQYKAKAYISRFPDKLRAITSRSTFKQEFSKLRDPLSEKESEGKSKEEVEQINEANRALLDDIERELGAKNSNGLIKDGVFTTIAALEGIIRAIRENKDNKFPPMLVNTVGQVNLDGLGVVLDSRPEFHDCLDELLIKYSDYNSFLMHLSVEKRLLLIILAASFAVNRINQEETEKLKNKKIDPKKPNSKLNGEFKDL